MLKNGLREHWQPVITAAIIKMKNMTIRVVYDNIKNRKDLTADWGFSAVIETKNKKILFDTGSDGHILLENMRRMQIDPGIIDTIFISHYHFDHTGGLAAFLHENSDVPVYVPHSFRGVRRAREVIYIAEEYKIDEGLYSTGELKGIEQSLVIKTQAGVVVVVGCSHPGLEEIVNIAQKFGHIHALIGGFHGFKNYEILKAVAYLCPTHCTQHILEISTRYPEKYLSGGVGTRLSFPKET